MLMTTIVIFIFILFSYFCVHHHAGCTHNACMTVLVVACEYVGKADCRHDDIDKDDDDVKNDEYDDYNDFFVYVSGLSLRNTRVDVREHGGTGCVWPVCM